VEFIDIQMEILASIQSVTLAPSLPLEFGGEMDPGGCFLLANEALGRFAMNILWLSIMKAGSNPL